MYIYTPLEPLEADSWVQRRGAHLRPRHPSGLYTTLYLSTYTVGFSATAASSHTFNASQNGF